MKNLIGYFTRKRILIIIVISSFLSLIIFYVINSNDQGLQPIYIESFVLDDLDGQPLNILDLHNQEPLIINFWATWCAPCKKEMPSLDALYQDSNFKNLEVLAVNMEQPNRSKAKKFFDDIKIKKLQIFFDSKLNFVKEFKLRGVPTTILINKKGEEFARIIGEVNFQEKKFLKWLRKYD